MHPANGRLRIAARRIEMATLFALLYPDLPTRDAALETVHGLEDAGYLHVIESALVTKDPSGHVEYKGSDRSVRSDTTKGLALGALTGVIFAVPVAGIAVGTVTGLMIGRHQQHGDSREFPEFARDVEQALQPGGCAVLMLAESESPDRVIQVMAKHGGKLMSTELSADRLAEIQKRIDQASSV
jgi:uncharacterized membrane protein